MDVMLKKFTVEGFRSFHDKVTLGFSHPHDYEWHNGSDDASYITKTLFNENSETAVGTNP